MSRTIQDIYEKYNVMPSLQLHMLRVGVVAKTIGDNWEGEKPNMNAVITACLLHDIANIIKFNLTLYPEFLEPEGIVYRESVKKSHQKYGATDHEATIAIVEEIGVDHETYDILHNLVAYPFQYSVSSRSIALKICDFSDMCVSPYGIIPWRQRVQDLEGRNMKNHNISKEKSQERTKIYFEGLSTIEDLLEKNCSIIKDISSYVKEQDIDELRLFQL